MSFDNDKPMTEETKGEVSDGSSADYYFLPSYAKQLQHLIAYKDMNAQMGEIFRATYRYGQVAHSERERDLKKIIFYAGAELERLELVKGSETTEIRHVEEAAVRKAWGMEALDEIAGAALHPAAQPLGTTSSRNLPIGEKPAKKVSQLALNAMKTAEANKLRAKIGAARALAAIFHDGDWRSDRAMEICEQYAKDLLLR